MEPEFPALFVSALAGEQSAADALFATLYTELHQLAERKLARSGGGLTIGVTTLLHEAYLDMSRREGAVFPDRGRFMAYAAKVMRNLIIDYARQRRAEKRGGGFEITQVGADAESVADHAELTRIGECLADLAGIDPALAEVVDLRFFCGFSMEEIAAMRRVSAKTVQRDWVKARVLLRRALGGTSLG
jgi:RNA polymerase sigma factor (TIGR02999 family)